MAALASTREAKTAAIGVVKGKFDKMTSAVFLDYKGLTVEQATMLRARFRKAGVDYKVVKNTIVKHALKDTAYGPKLSDVLVGMTGIAWCYEDPSAAAKVVKQFQKDRADAKDRLKVKAGLIEGEVLDAARVENELAMMPGKDELRATLLATFMAPATDLVRTLAAGAQNFVYVLAAKEREAGGQAAA